jgi:hypothetical protein
MRLPPILNEEEQLRYRENHSMKRRLQTLRPFFVGLALGLSVYLLVQLMSM